MTLNHHGFPVRDWTLADLPVEDCSLCGKPVYDLPEYGGEHGRVLVDAMPLRTFRLVGHEQPHLVLEHAADDPALLHFSEHVCELER